MRNVILARIGGSLSILGQPSPPVVGNAYSFSFLGAFGIAPYTFTQTGLPAWATFTSSTPNGTITGTPAGSDAGITSFTVTLTDSNRGVVSNTYSLNVSALPLTISGAPSNPTAGIPYTFAFTVSGGFGGNNCTLLSGSIPTGMSLSSSGVLSGTMLATAGGPYSGVVKVVDSHSNTATTPFSFTVTVLSISITNSATTPCTAGTPYSFTYTKSGGAGAVTWSFTGTLPPGLSLSSSGVLSGTPTTGGNNASFTVIVTDNAGSQATEPQTVNTNYATLSVSGAFTDGGVNLPLGGSATITGGQSPYSVALHSGTAPPNAGFAVSGSTITSTTNVSAFASGTYSYVLRITSTDSQTFDLSCTTVITAAANSLRTKIASFWGFNSAITDQARGSNTFSTSTSFSYTTGVGSRNALAATTANGITQLPNGYNAYHGTQKWAFGAFIKPTTLANDHIAFGQTNTGGNLFITVGSQTGVWVAKVVNSGGTTFTATGTTAAVVGTLAHVVVACNGTNIILYVNGAQEASITGPTTAIKTLSTTGFCIGPVSGTTNAVLQDMFWMHALPTANEIVWMYNQATGRVYSTDIAIPYATTTHDAVLSALTPTGFYKLNQTSGTTATDSGTLGNGTMQTGATFSNSVAAPAGFTTDFVASFDGSTGLLTLPAINCTTGSLSYSLYGFFRAQSFPDAGSVYTRFGSSSANGNDARGINAVVGDNTALSEVFNNSTGTNLVSLVSPTSEIATSTWYQLAAIYDSPSKTLLMCKNGIVIGGIVSSSDPTAANCTAVSIGARSASAGRQQSRVSRAAFFKSATIDLGSMAKLNDLGFAL